MIFFIKQLLLTLTHVLNLLQQDGWYFAFTEKKAVIFYFSVEFVMS